MNKKINLITFVLVEIIVLAFGIGIGYLITKNIKNEQIISEVSSKEKETHKQIEKNEKEETEKNINTTKDEQIQYDGTQSITINGKYYEISYNLDFYQYDDTYPVVINLYFNDKKIRSINMPIQHGDIENGEMINKEYKVQLYNISNEYILVVISNKSKQTDAEDAELCVVNLNGEYIGSRHWKRGGESISLKADSKDLVRYEIYEDGFLIFGRFSSEKFVDMKYTILNNKIEGKQERFYSIDEVSIAGK